MKGVCIGGRLHGQIQETIGTVLEVSVLLEENGNPVSVDHPVIMEQYDGHEIRIDEGHVLRMFILRGLEMHEREIIQEAWLFAKFDRVQSCVHPF